MARRRTDEERALLVAFGRRIRAHRLELGYSQERLAHEADLHRTYVGGVERGERNLSLLHVTRLAAALHVHPGELMSGPPVAE